jgi:4'-phosphopantetheinyl transferase
MLLHLYSTEYCSPLPDATFQALLTLLPTHLQQQVLRFRLWQDRHASLLGKLLLRIALKNAGLSTDLGRLHYTTEKKPFFPEGPAFNISHSGHRVICLLGDQRPLGIDIESLSPLPFDDFQPQFTENEWAAILSDPSPLSAFYRFWTAKESILKADGRGLGIPLQSIDLSKTMTPTVDGATWSVHELPLFENYACHYAIELRRESQPDLEPAPIADPRPNSQPAGEPGPGFEPPIPPTIELHELTITHWHDLAHELSPF